MGTISSRAAVASQLGLSFNEKRDIYESCGYKKTLKFDDYRNVYDRGDIGKTIISAKPDATWVEPPVVREVKDSEENQTPFEKAFTELADDLTLYSYINRADTLAGIGEYGILFLGFDDGRSFDKPVAKGSKLKYVRPYAQGSITIQKYNTTKTDKRFGYPEIYDISMGNGQFSDLEKELTSDVTIKTTPVHWSRVIHIADNKDESEVFGVPRLKPLFNRLYDVQKILGSSGEMFWQGAFMGLQFNAQADAAIINKEDMEDEIEKYVHGLQRYIKTQGIDVKPLGGMAINPSNHIAVQLQFIAGTTRIPLRILTGSERGELASVQDEYNWKDRITERRTRFATDEIMKPLINRLVELKAIPAPKNAYYLDWSDISATTRKQKMETGRIVTDSLRMYVESGTYNIMAPEIYLEKVMGFSKEEVASMGPFDVSRLQQSESITSELNKKSGEEITDDKKFVDKPE